MRAKVLASLALIVAVTVNAAGGIVEARLISSWRLESIDTREAAHRHPRGPNAAPPARDPATP